jgi:hypothetical protein
MSNLFKLQGGNEDMNIKLPTVGGMGMDMDALNKQMTAGRRHRHKKHHKSHHKSHHKRHHKRKGGNVLSELAVPAVLLLANQNFGNKSKKFRSNRRFSRRRSSRFL